MKDNSYYYKRIDFDEYQEVIWEEEDMATFVELEEGEILIIEKALRDLATMSLVADWVGSDRPEFKIDFAYGRDRYMNKLDSYMRMTHTFEKEGDLKKDYTGISSAGLRSVDKLKSRRFDVGGTDTDFLIEFYFMLYFGASALGNRIFPYIDLNVFKKQDDYFYFELKIYNIKTTTLSHYEMLGEKFITYRCDGIWGLKKFLQDLAQDMLGKQKLIIDFFEP